MIIILCFICPTAIGDIRDWAKEKIALGIKNRLQGSSNWAQCLFMDVEIPKLCWKMLWARTAKHQTSILASRHANIRLLYNAQMAFLCFELLWF